MTFTKQELEMLIISLRIAIEDGTLSDSNHDQLISGRLINRLRLALGRHNYKEVRRIQSMENSK
jgi:hypothetical protein